LNFLALAALVAAVADSTLDAAAKAPPLATTILPANVQTAPALDADVLAVLPADAEIELTGSAAPGYLQVYYDDEPAWVPAQFLSLSDRPGIDTAVAAEDLPLRDAPFPDASVLSIVPEGDTVILTGASLDGYDAASHEGVGGWLREAGLIR
jgi:hypothetical protein